MHIGWFIRNLTNTIVFKKKISKGQFVVVLIFGYMYIMQKRLYIYFMYTFSKCHQDATKWHKCHICGILFSWFPWRLRASDHKKQQLIFYTINYDEVVACGSITLHSKTVWGRYSSVAREQKSVLKKQKNRVVDSIPYMQKYYRLFYYKHYTTYLTICPKKYFF